MELVGTLTAELFLLADGSLVVNELAQRVHNSGRCAIEGAATSQFEQHVRAICGLALGATDALAPAAMVNLLGTGQLAAGVPRRRRAMPSTTPRSTSTSTTSDASSKVARWGTSRRSGRASTGRSPRRARGAGRAGMGDEREEGADR